MSDATGAADTEAQLVGISTHFRRGRSQGRCRESTPMQGSGPELRGAYRAKVNSGAPARRAEAAGQR